MTLWSIPPTQSTHLHIVRWAPPWQLFLELSPYAISFCCCKNSRPPARTISGSLEVEKQTENETTKRAHARFGPGTLISPQKFHFFYRPPDWFHTSSAMRMKRKKFFVSFNDAFPCLSNSYDAILIDEIYEIVGCLPQRNKCGLLKLKQECQVHWVSSAPQTSA